MTDAAQHNMKTIQPTAQSPGKLIEIDYDYGSQPWRESIFTLAVPGGVALLFTALLLLALLGLILTVVANVGPLVLVVAILCLAIAILVWTQINDRAAIHLARKVPAESPEAVLRAGLNATFTVAAASLIRHAVREAVTAGMGDITIRIADPQKRLPIRPIPVPFEPVTLDEADPAFHNLSSGLDASDDKSKGGPDSIQVRSPEQLWFASYLKHHGGVLGLVGALIVLVLGAFAMWKKPILGITFYTMSIIIASSLLRPRPGWRQRGRWLIVPSALVYRRLGRTGSRMDVRVIPRRNSVLCVSSAAPLVWKVRFAHATGSYEITCSEAEANMLLRAWLSPLPPPTLDKLSDLQ